MKRLRPGWSFNDGTAIHVGSLPYRKRPCVYVQEGSVITVLGHLKSEEAADKLAEYHAKLAGGSL